LKPTSTIRILTIVFLILNFADFATTYIGITSGKAVEANPIWFALDGPLAPAAIFVKLAVIPAFILGTAWLLWRRFKDSNLNMAVIIPASAVLAGVVANNVIIIAKKARKVVRAHERRER
jgi:hypothetical protein